MVFPTRHSVPVFFSSGISGARCGSLLMTKAFRDIPGLLVCEDIDVNPGHERPRVGDVPRTGSLWASLVGFCVCCSSRSVML